MSINSKYNGTIIGGIFTFGSLLLTLTFVIPIISIIPAAYIENLVSIFVDNEPYSNVGKGTLVVFAIMFIIFLAIVLIKSRNGGFSNFRIVLIMIIGYFLVHSLGFYIYWATYLNFRSDGQLIFAAVKSYPISSFGLVMIGFLIDLVKKVKKTSNH